MKDYCSFSPDGDWGECCKKHDINYGKIYLMRLSADKALKEGIEKKNHFIVAKIYYFFVRIFGRLFV